MDEYINTIDVFISTQLIRLQWGFDFSTHFYEKSRRSGTYTLHLHALTGKKVVIDASIYLYRFLAEKNLIEHIYLMCSILRHYNIHPLFIFDGKAPNAKKEIIIKRKEKKEGSKAYVSKMSVLAYPYHRSNGTS